MLTTVEQQLLPDVHRATSGDIASFERLIQRCRQTVTGIALSIVKDLDASEEVAQQVFIHVWQQLGTLREPASFLPWVRQITRYRAYNYLRDHKINQKVVGEEAEFLLEQFADPNADVAENLQRSEQNVLIQQLIDELPEDSREIVVLYYREEQSSQQVAELLGLSDENVRKKLSRVRELLKTRLLTRYGQLLLSTAPGIGFSSMIVALLATASPPAAAAATSALLTASGATGSTSGAGMLGKISLLASGALLGGAGAALAIFLGMKPALSRARTEQERNDLLQLRFYGMCWIFAIVTLFILSYQFDPGPWAPILCYGLFILSMMLHQWRLWVLIKPRMAWEKLHDPSAAARHRRQQIGCILGTVVGYGSGIGGFIYALFRDGRL